ncbi:hypothetical protein NKI72_22010 [Mesorhizobium sp. M0437]|uniref:helix-turn-helix domain-containing protein n=1 Tax=Mesorhizobium sp. M0437 TaxID=2956945 RepID=UPI00333DBAD5
MRRNKLHRGKAAAALGITRKTLYNKIKKHRIRSGPFREPPPPTATQFLMLSGSGGTTRKRQLLRRSCLALRAHDPDQTIGIPPLQSA